MANSLSAKKRNRQNIKRRGKNRWRKRLVKEAVNAFEDELSKGEAGNPKEKLDIVYKKIDKLAAKGVIHKGTAARKKSRLTVKMNKAGI